tara:strand:- start:725 stop:1027 length:303 start_codon:yes stop_codon:yes gene_type:complete
VFGSIVTVMTTMGEYVGKVATNDSKTGITLTHPRMIVMNEENMGFANGIAMTSVDMPKTVTFSSYIFVTPTDEEVAAAWEQHTAETSGIVMPPQSKIIGS